MPPTPKILGQAYDKSDTYIYTWYENQTLTRVRVYRDERGGSTFGNIENVPYMAHNEINFYEFVSLKDTDNG